MKRHAAQNVVARCRSWATTCVRLSGLLCCLLLGVTSVSDVAADAAGQRWLLIDTAAGTLSVMQDKSPILTLGDIAIGRYGTNEAKHKGDGTTPLGGFRITEIRPSRTFYRFIALNYPNGEQARRGIREGSISASEQQSIMRALGRGDTPPADTPLGGRIGIHGLGRGDPAMHEAMNWTQGCVALTNQQIDQLLPLISVGTTVVIR